MRVEAPTFRQFVAALAAPLGVSGQALSRERVHLSERVAGIAKLKVVRPSAQVRIDFLDQVGKGFEALSWASHLPQGLTLPLHRTPGGKQVPVAERSPFPVTVVAKAVPQKVQRLSRLGQVEDLGFIPVEFQPQPSFNAVLPLPMPSRLHVHDPFT